MELAIRRYENELQELRAKEIAVGSRHFAPVRGTIVCGSCVLLAGVAVITATFLHTDGLANAGPLGFVMLLLGAYMLLFAYRNSDRDSMESRELREHIAELEHLIEKQKRIDRTEAEA